MELASRLYSPEAIRQADRRAIEEFGIEGRLLMEVAGASVAGVAAEIAAFPSALVLCGPGNNGGDGFVCARHLASRGFEVQVQVFGARERFSPETEANYQLLETLGIPVKFIGGEEELYDGNLDFSGYGVLVDALLGIGAHGAPRGPIALALSLLEFASAPIVSVDVPSGVDAYTGAVHQSAVKSDVTVTFELPKVGLYQYPAAAYAGEIRVVPIGLPWQVLSTLPACAELTTAWTAAELLDEVLASRPPDAHKGTLGTLLVVAGSVGMSGAAILCAKAALQMGCGLVKVAVPEPLVPLVDPQVLEAVVLPMPATEEGALALEALDLLEQLATEVDAVALGPGLGRHEETRQLVQAFLKKGSCPVVVDADALNALEGVDLRTAWHRPVVLTPHPGEMARLLSTSVQAIQNNRLEAATHLARQAAATVILKGAGSIVADPSGDLYLNSTGNDGMATGGSGDVLTGLVGSLLAQGHSPLLAARLATYLHGLAGDLAAEVTTRPALLPSDLIGWLADAMRELLEESDVQP